MVSSTMTPRSDAWRDTVCEPAEVSTAGESSVSSAFVSLTELFSDVCSAALVPVVSLPMFTTMPTSGRSWLRIASASGRSARGRPANMSTAYCGTTMPENAPVPTARLSNCSVPRSTRSSCV